MRAKMERKFGSSVFLVLFLAWEARAAVNCTATGAGRFANADDTTCKNYTFCVYISSSDSYVSYDYVCPSTSVFNSNTSQCIDPSNYVCNVTTTTDTTSLCTEDGYVADPSSTNCTSYIECVDFNGTFIETNYTCPDTTYYNPNTTLCEADYNCTDSTSTFTCTAAGRFANTSDTTCQTYYLCVLSSNGTYSQYDYTCSSNTLFNPTASACTRNYVCS